MQNEFDLEKMLEMHWVAERALRGQVDKTAEGTVEWYKHEVSADSFCNLIIRSGSTLYAIVPTLSEGFGVKTGNPAIDDIPGIHLRRGARFLPNAFVLEQVLPFCEENNMVPCFFPLAKSEDGTLHAATEGWNLWGVEQGAAIDPVRDGGSGLVRLSNWELHRMALNNVLEDIVKKQGGEVCFYYDPAPIAPQIFFRDAHGRMSCVTVKTGFKGREPLALLTAPPALREKALHCIQYEATVLFCARNYRDGRFYRMEKLKVSYDGLHAKSWSRCAQVLLGVMAGDMIGSIYEGRHSRIKKKYGWPLFKGPVEFQKGASHFTDDTSMTLAICLALLEAQDDYDDLPEQTVKAMQGIGRKYFWGFGSGFKNWLRSDNPQPYGSWGNGAAMRVSPCALAGNSVEEVKALSHAVTAVTHNHEEGLKGAEAVAVCIFLALQGKSAAEVQAYCHEHYYPMDFKVDDIRADYSFDVSCQGSVPQALKAAFEGPDYESAIRSCVALGGDSDTQAAIAGGLAAALYGLPEEIAKEAWARIPQSDLREIFEGFENKYGSLAHEL